MSEANGDSPSHGSPRIRTEREARGWSREDLAKRFRHAIAERGDTPVSHESMLHNLYRWERMADTPSERYRIVYTKVFGLTQLELFGIPTAPPPASSAADPDCVVVLPDGCRRVIIEIRGG
jgi:transcriptional regulator with XRE-family HTH domain